VVVEDRLFATLDPLTREVDIGSGQGGRVLLTDTVGFIRKLPHHLIASFRATLEEVKEADLLLHVIDASHPAWEEQRAVVEDVLADLGVGPVPLCYVFNKMDRLSEPDTAALEERVHNLMPDSVFVSALAVDGLAGVRERLVSAVHAARPLAVVRLPADAGKLLAELYREAEVLGVGSDGPAVVVRVRLDETVAGRLRRAGAVVSYGDGNGVSA
jgi:GTP-binding protein HflX